MIGADTTSKRNTPDAMLRRYLHRLDRKSASLIAWVERHIETLTISWMVALGAMVALRIAIRPGEFAANPDNLPFLLAYFLIIVSPIGALLMSLRVFPRGMVFAQPHFRFARIGQWRAIDVVAQRQHPAFGAHGLMTGLVIGLLVNIVFRSGEFLMGVPAIGTGDPAWARELFLRMAVDVIAINTLYGVAFVMALRHVPLFPRFMLLIWVADIASQMMIARGIAGVGNVPPGVAQGLVDLLTGNLQKAFIGIGLWMPYLLLSARVNVTYRQRVRASEPAR